MVDGNVVSVTSVCLWFYYIYIQRYYAVYPDPELIQILQFFQSSLSYNQARFSRRDQMVWYLAWVVRQLIAKFDARSYRFLVKRHKPNVELPDPYQKTSLLVAAISAREKLDSSFRRNQTFLVRSNQVRIQLIAATSSARER